LFWQDSLRTVRTQFEAAAQCHPKVYHALLQSPDFSPSLQEELNRWLKDGPPTTPTPNQLVSLGIRAHKSPRRSVAWPAVDDSAIVDGVLFAPENDGGSVARLLSLSSAAGHSVLAAPEVLGIAALQDLRPADFKHSACDFWLLTVHRLGWYGVQPSIRSLRWMWCNYGPDSAALRRRFEVPYLPPEQLKARASEAAYAHVLDSGDRYFAILDLDMFTASVLACDALLQLPAQQKDIPDRDARVRQSLTAVMPERPEELLRLIRPLNEALVQMGGVTVNVDAIERRHPGGEPDPIYMVGRSDWETLTSLAKEYFSRWDDCMHRVLGAAPAAWDYLRAVADLAPGWTGTQSRLLHDCRNSLAQRTLDAPWHVPAAVWHEWYNRLEELLGVLLTVPLRADGSAVNTEPLRNERQPEDTTEPPLISYTQDELDGELRKYRAKRSAKYAELKQLIEDGSTNAIEGARTIFGRNAMARELRCKAPAMISHSSVWKQIREELRLGRSTVARIDKRAGLDGVLATRPSSYPDAAKTVAEAELRRRIAKLPKEVRDSIRSELSSGKIDKDQALKFVETYEQHSDDAGSSQPGGRS
jgi:hypothetical protein